MLKDVLLFTEDLAQATNEIKALGGRVTHEFTDKILIARIPDSFDASLLNLSTSKIPSKLDQISQVVIDAWNTMKQKKTALKKASVPERIIPWDTPGYEAPVTIGLPGIPPATSSYLVGRVGVGLVIVSGPASDSLNITNQETIKILQEVMEGLDFLANAEPRANLTFSYQINTVDITAQPLPSCSSYMQCEDVWRGSALTKLGFDPSQSGCTQYINNLAQKNSVKWAYLSFFTKYQLFNFAYAYPTLGYICMNYQNGSWGPDEINRIFAHETCHVFGASDEYQSAPCDCLPSYSNINIPNCNCDNCQSLFAKVDCLMKGNTLSLCPWTRGQIGWLYPDINNKTGNSFIAAGNQMHVFCKDSSTTISDVWFDGNNWNYQNIMGNVTTPPKVISPFANGAPFGIVYNGQQHVLYRDTNNQISDIYYANNWIYQNLTTMVQNAPNAQGDPFSIVCYNQQHVLYRDTNNQISDIYYGNNWIYQNLTTIVGAPNAQGDPFSVIYNNQQHVLYRDTNNYIPDIYFDGSNWHYQNLSIIVNAPDASGNPFSFSTNTNQMHVIYRDINNQISDIWFNGNTWKYKNVSTSITSPNAVGDPCSFMYLNQQHFLYRDTNNNISDIWFDGTWHYQNLSTIIPNTPNASGDPFAVVYNSNQPHVLYRDTNNNISDVWFDGTTWKYQRFQFIAPFVTNQP